MSGRPELTRKMGGWVVRLCVLQAATSLAAADVITIDASLDLGPSVVDKVLGSVYPMPAPWNSPENPLVKAWNESGMKQMRVHPFESPASIVVTRNPDGDLELNFNSWDQLMTGILDWCDSEFFVEVVWMPQALSSGPDEPDYYAYAPADYAEWADVLARIVEHVATVQGLTGVTYEVWGEPEHELNWKGSFGNPDPLLDQYIEFYVETYRAIKAADPTARVGGPSTASYESVECSGGANEWGLRDFVLNLKDYNDQHPNDPVALDYLSWHDYGCYGYRINAGANYVDNVVEEVGVPTPTFPAYPPYLLTEWNKGFGNYVDPGERGAYMAYNLIEQANPLTARFESTYFYIFYFFGEPEPYNTEMIGFEEDDSICYRSTFAASEMASAMSNGTNVSATADEFLAVAAVIDSQNRLVFSAANNRPEEHTMTVHVVGLPFEGSEVERTTQWIDSTYSVDCDGLDVGITDRLTLEDGTVFFDLTFGGYAAVLVTLTPVSSPCDGDANGDGTVDPLDAGYVLARFGCLVGGGDTACDAADVNGDATVDPLDAGYVLARFGQCGG